MMQSCSSRACRVAGESKPPKFNAIMINCSRLIATSEETHNRHSNNTPTRGSSFNARIAQIRRPLPLGLSHLAACPSHGTTLRTRASPTGTWPPCSLPLTWSNASRNSLSHWDSTTLQLAPHMEQRFAQEPLPLGLGHLAACPYHGSTLRVRASPTGTRPPCSLPLTWSNASCKSLSHWDSATLQFAPHMEQRFTQEPLPLGLDHLEAFSSHGSTLRARASPTGTRPPSSLPLPWSNASSKSLSHRDLATYFKSNASRKSLSH
ncbi:hypothetical protein Adt_45221 [Abeliophyllum distichum]|uniref:Uncharacterized protein n=1 Tax=Abeliophyllum distichum TaxID=126358 RepID=A0ABD1PGV6_9LAMI